MSRRVLVVDDARPIRMMLQGYLARLNILPGDIQQAEDGAKGLALFQESNPEVVIMDIEMPEMSGRDAAIEMLSLRPDLKLFVMTGLDATDPRVRDLRSQGAFAILHKPVRFEALRDAFRLLEEDERGFQRIR